MTATAPYGTWPSPVTPESMTGGQVVLSEVRVDGPDTYWLEGRPAEGGRQALVRHDGSTARDVLAAPWNARTAIHEYGGGSYAVAGGRVVFSHAGDGRLYRLDPGAQEPVALTPEGPWRYGGLVLHDDVVLAVREDLAREPEPADELVRIPLDGESAGVAEVLFGGTDFVSRPAVSPDGRSLAWVVWDHPNMPWDSTRLLRAPLGADGLGEPQVVAGGEGVSVAQPVFGPDGALWFVSDASGWWLVHRDAGDGPVAVHDVEADHATPPWVLGVHDLAVLDADHALVHWWEGPGQGLGVLDATTGDVAISSDGGAFHDSLVAAGDGEVALRRGHVDALPAVVRGPAAGPYRVLATSAPQALDPGYVSAAEPWAWTDSAGLDVHGLLFRPRHPELVGPEGERPPLVVMVHGGPTSRSEAGFSSAVHFWTTRGFAVLDVNYSGSTGYGRAYRDRLLGQWGVIDIDDCVTGARSLADAGVVDGDRLVIRGGSAGGYAVLRAMTTSDAFAAGTSLFGVGDIAALAQDTHKFESRYTDRLIAPWPEGEEIYRDRSPVHHADRLHGELLLLQGDADLVVPLAQAETMAAAMRAAGRDVELTVYEGEGHGFRRSESLIDAYERELAFYRRVLALGA
ncbi:S9 family peptidase [Phycicoccus duodecadis]|uniref:Dipeptidyl aminopeptidase/acylaminoacyl peptidase n=1 Tax=Phycicoccus duodecadis TaxID=173053 RepID=A0A2N3YF20_9MICO|nr:prolyl oligopeptidase family serine peptidase [Phycicoccus duodecadis]PKW25452.1 dipeptidyl aminopeptidase/acylaminoacyl peptidase [Phycicoccus duodecadis]